MYVNGAKSMPVNFHLPLDRSNMLYNILVNVFKTSATLLPMTIFPSVGTMPVYVGLCTFYLTDVSQHTIYSSSRPLIISRLANNFTVINDKTTYEFPNLGIYVAFNIDFRVTKISFLS